MAAQGARLRLVATDGVFSMDGDIAPLQAICALARKHGAYVFVGGRRCTARPDYVVPDEVVPGLVQVQVHATSAAFPQWCRAMLPPLCPLQHLLYHQPHLLPTHRYKPPCPAADECHATGFVGATGRGTDEHCGVHGQVDIINSTLGKALGGATGGQGTRGGHRWARH